MDLNLASWASNITSCCPQEAAAAGQGKGFGERASRHGVTQGSGRQHNLELGTIVVQCQMSALRITMHQRRTRDNTMHCHQQVYKSSPLNGKWEISRAQTWKKHFHLLYFYMMLFLCVFFFFLLIGQAQNLPLILNTAPFRGPWAIPL